MYSAVITIYTPLQSIIAITAIIIFLSYFSQEQIKNLQNARQKAKLLRRLSGRRSVQQERDPQVGESKF